MRSEWQVSKMTVPVYHWPAEAKFIGREAAQTQLLRWWEDDGADHLNMYGRRRVGKSWLFRKFAHDKKAIILVAEKTTRSRQLAKFADELEPFLGFKPAIREIGDLFTILFNLAATEKILVVVDEFAHLLGTTSSEIDSSLHAVAKVNEDLRDNSMIKLILCGSALSEMESMQEQSSPLFGRVQKFELAPLTFREARSFFTGDDVLDHLTRYSVAGGMPKYLTLLGKGGDFAKTLVDNVVSPNSPMYSDVSALLEAELNQPAVYFAILAELSVRPREIGEIADAIGQESNSLGTYMKRLESMRIIKKKQPLGSDPKSRSYQWECIDGYIRFWFRFVWQYRNVLEAGGDPELHVKQHIMPALAEHTSMEFERTFERWVVQNYPTAALVGNWWGKAATARKPMNRSGRSKEEIDVVGVKGRIVQVLGEAKWRNGNLKISVATDLENYKIPALIATGLSVPVERTVVLASRGGFTKDIRQLASSDNRIRLLDAVTLLNEVK